MKTYVTKQETYYSSCKKKKKGIHGIRLIFGAAFELSRCYLNVLAELPAKLNNCCMFAERLEDLACCSLIIHHREA